MAIPRAKPLEREQKGKSKQTRLIGAVNYSTSPKSNIFEGSRALLVARPDSLERKEFNTLAYYISIAQKDK